MARTATFPRPPARRRTTPLLGLLALTLTVTLAACGSKGPLTLPKKAPLPTATDSTLPADGSTPPASPLSAPAPVSGAPVPR